MSHQTLRRTRRTCLIATPTSRRPVSAWLRAALLATWVAACAGCATTSQNAVGDPWEGFNRRMYDVNEGLDRYVLAPWARTYLKVVPTLIRSGIRNFFSNLEEPNTILNDLLQGKGVQGGQDALRFAFNTLFGLAGVLDIATPLGIGKNEEDFGQTFAVWGINSGPYVVLPLFGPSSLRDGFGLVADYTVIDPLQSLNTGEWLVVQTIKAIDVRSGLFSLERILDMQLDPYLFVRESYRQRRLNLIYDGAPPLDDSLFDDELDALLPTD